MFCINPGRDRYGFVNQQWESGPPDCIEASAFFSRRQRTTLP